MKTSMTLIALLGLLLSVAAAKNNNLKETKKSGKPAPAAASTESFDGWISDEKCGAKISAACSKICQASGAKLVFVTPEKTILPVSNQEAINGFAGQHVIIKGKLVNGALTVTSVKTPSK